jgi:uncharacterized protein
MKINNGVKKAIAFRLQFILDEEQRLYQHWQDHIKQRMKPTRSGQVERAFKQRIQALRIVVWMLTPVMERKEDFPGYWKN